MIMFSIVACVIICWKYLSFNFIFHSLMVQKMKFRNIYQKKTRSYDACLIFSMFMSTMLI